MYLDFPNNETIAPSDYILAHIMKGKKNYEMGDSPLLAIMLLPTLQYRCISIDQVGESCKVLLDQL
jgi:hypothetical protein